MYWSPPRVAACICHNVEQQQISAQANVYFVLWICISIFDIRAQFYFTPDADAGSNEARQWPSLGRNPRAGELAKDEEMHEAECILVQCTDSHCTYSQCTVHIARIHRSTRSARIQPPHPELFWSKHSEMGVGCKFEEGTSVEWNSTSTRNQPPPVRGKNRPKAAKLTQS